MVLTDVAVTELVAVAKATTQGILGVVCGIGHNTTYPDWIQGCTNIFIYPVSLHLYMSGLCHIS